MNAVWAKYWIWEGMSNVLAFIMTSVNHHGNNIDPFGTSQH